ncbi:DUF2252 domain-containing protein [Dongia sp.]|uniref:DUF2252 domain-containing protein n=1 Tax=Dongia sp. TaxID=1977262 RepID=UPI0037515CD2
MPRAARHDLKISKTKIAGSRQSAQPGAPGADRPAAALLAAGKALRDKLPRQDHAIFKRDKKLDVLALLKASDRGRIEQLLPIRYGRMLQSPFAFFRGSAGVMAADLAKSPATGIQVQACGDCHLMNFGGFATPERNILFDINDFDETAPAPWEWDLKRLVASFVLAARSVGLSDSKARDIAVTCARGYRKQLQAYSEMSPLEVWYARITLDDLLAEAPAALRKNYGPGLLARVKKATADLSSELIYPELAGLVGGQVRIHDAPPLIYHPDDVSADEWHDLLQAGLHDYAKTLADDRRALIDQYRLVDGAIKVVGIGSVGTSCLVILMMSANNDPLFLQWKEARQSVLEPYAGESVYTHPGQRVVMGQRLMQPATDVFMGWATGRGGKRGYMRQLRDVKIKPLVETMDAAALTFYAKMCGWVLARAHTKAGARELEIAGYLGSQDNFDEAMGKFAIAYADQAERDHAALKAAVRAGKIAVHIEE